MYFMLSITRFDVVIIYRSSLNDAHYIIKFRLHLLHENIVSYGRLHVEVR